MQLLASGPAVTALTRSREKARALSERGVEPAIADVMDPEAQARFQGKHVAGIAARLKSAA